MMNSREQQADYQNKPSTDSTTVVVTDTEDYGRTQKLKHIYKAKESVQKMRRNQEELVKEYDDYWHQTHGRDVYHRELAKSVASYGSELLPIINQALDQDQLATPDLLSDRFSIDIRDFISTDGQKIDTDSGDTEPYNILQTLDVYRHLNTLLRELGLGLQLEEEKGPAEI
mgnify:FL=1